MKWVILILCLAALAVLWQQAEHAKLASRPDVSADQAMHIALDGIAFDCKNQGRPIAYCHAYKVFYAARGCDGRWYINAVSARGNTFRQVLVSRQGDYRDLVWNEEPLGDDRNVLEDLRSGRAPVVLTSSKRECPPRR